MAFTGSSDHNAKAWVIEFGNCTRTFTGPKRSIICLKHHKGLRKFGTIPLSSVYLLIIYFSKVNVNKFGFFIVRFFQYFLVQAIRIVTVSMQN